MKNDIKYIMKRIIIGVGIAFGVMLVKGLPVFAEELQNYYIFYDEDFFNSGSYVFSLKPTQHTNSSIIDSFIVYDNYKVNLTMDNNFNYNGYYYLLYNETKNQYIMQYFASKEKLDFNYTYGLVYSQLSSGAPFQITLGSLKVFYNSDFKSITAPIDLNNYTNNVDYKTLNYSVLGESIYYGYTISKNSDNSLSIKRNSDRVNENEWKIVSTNIKSNIYKQLNQKVYNFYTYDTTPPIPTGYEMIDMLGKDAVLFYPKDFREIDNVCSETSSIIGGSVAMCNQFDYYYTFYLKGSFDTALKNLGLNSSEYDRAALENYSKATEYTKIVKSNYYDTGILFYPTNISSGTGSVASSEYKVYYDSSKLNYIIIDNIDDFTGEDISYIDKNGDEVSTKIDSVKKRTDIEYSESDDFNVDYDESSIKSFDISSGFKSFINMLSDGVNFFKKYMGEFMKDIPQFVFYFVIFIPILSIVVAVIKIINR